MHCPVHPSMRPSGWGQLPAQGDAAERRRAEHKRAGQKRALSTGAKGFSRAMKRAQSVKCTVDRRYGLSKEEFVEEYVTAGGHRPPMAM